MDTHLPKSQLQFTEQLSHRAVTLRKSKRNEGLMHKRLKTSYSPNPTISLEDALAQLDLNSLSSVKTFRKLLCHPDFDHYKLFHLHPNIIETLSPGLANQKSELAYEVCWCFTNLALGPSYFTSKIAEYIPVFADFVISAHNKMLAEQACWVLGNLAADRAQHRDAIKQVCRLLQGLSNLLTYRIPSMSTVTCWTLCNLVRGQNSDVSLFLEAGVLQPVIDLTLRHWSSDVCVEALWFLTFLTNNPGTEVFETLSPHFVRLLGILDAAIDSNIILPVIRILGNAFCYYLPTETILNEVSYFSAFQKLLSHNDPKVVRDCLWLYSNMLSGSSGYIDFFMKNEAANDTLDAFNQCLTSENNDVRNEAAIAFYNLAVAQDSAYLLKILRICGPFLIDFFTKLVNDVPSWLMFNIHGLHDADLLRISVDFLSLALEWKNHLDLPEAIYERLQQGDIPEALFHCHSTLSKNARPSSVEALIIKNCIEVLYTHYANFEGSV